MRNINAILCGAALAFFASTSLTQTTVAGFIDGSLRVTQSGAAEYRVPIPVSPGIAGMEPKLALVYDSQADNGLLGMGWDLTGFSGITRCPRTLAQDGVRGGVNYDWNDRYCLDGERLIAISGSNGADGTEYRTERDIFTKVVSYGVAGNGPAWFKAWSKSGEILEYGNTADSRIEAEGKSTVRLWAVNRISDRNDNYLTVTYTEDSSYGDFRPNRIDYTGSTTPPQTPSSSIQFSYETRPDPLQLYHGGSIINKIVRLANIRTYVGAVLVKDFQLVYDNNGANGRSRLSQLKECDGVGGCFPAMTFTWQASGNASFSYSGNPTPNIEWYGATTLDFNGDGKSDYLINTTNGGWQAFQSNGDGTFSLASTISGSVDFHSPSVGDFNGDGKHDFLINSGNSGWFVYFSNGDGTFTYQGTVTSNSAWHSVAIGDFDDDGRSDFLINTNSDWAVWFSNGDGTFTFRGNVSPYSQWHSPRIGDFDGDGRSDFIINTTNGGWNVYFSNGDGTFSYKGTPTPYSEWYGLTIGDFNGDGKSDYLVNTTSSWDVYLSRGDGTFSYRGAVSPYPQWHSPAIGDFDGDGKSDFLINTTSTWDVWTSEGDGTFAYRGTVSPYAAWHSVTVGDFSGDGRSDYLINTATPGGGWYVYFANTHTDPLPDLLLSVTNGPAGSITISYKPLTDTSVYTKDATAAYPKVDLQLPLHVVLSHTASNGIGGTVTTTYKYGGLKSSYEGRGSLGFRWMRAIDEQTGIRVRTDHRQDWPYVGLTSVVKKTQSSGAVLNQVTNTYSCINPATGGTCTVAAGNRYFPFISQSIETGNDLNGAALPTVTTTAQYDSYGNPTSITVDTSDSYNNAITNNYTNDVPNWRLGKLTRSMVQSTKPDAETLTRTSGFEYDPPSGLVIRNAIEPDNSDLCLVRTYSYDAYGNRASATTRNCNGTSSGGLIEAAAPSGNTVFVSRTASAAYAAGTQTVGGTLSWSAGQFPTTNTNALGHQKTREFDPRFGGVSKLTGPNGLVTWWTYDSFGRKATENRSDGTSTTWTYTICGTCPAHGNYFVTETGTGAPTKIIYLDSLNREIRRRVQGFDGTLVRIDTEYDSLGRVLRVSKPYYAGASPVWTTYQYDILGRVTQIDEPSTSAGTTRTVNAYNALVMTAIVSNAGGSTNMPNGALQTRTTTKNSQGQVVQVTDTQGSTVTYIYDPFGNLKQTNAGGVITTASYDRRGRKTNMVDPDMGTWQYDYNALSELVWQKDANNQVTTMAYDKLGRMTQRTEVGLTSKWFYDAYPTGQAEWDASLITGLIGDCSRGKGKLCYVWADNDYRQAHTYEPEANKAGRPLDSKIRVDTDYVVKATYDSSGRIDTTTYPTGFAVQNVYNARGYLWKVQRVNDPDTTVYWTANTQNAAGQVTSELLGNGLTTTRTYDALFRMTAVQSGTVHNLAYSFDAIGNVIQRIDNVQAITENFTYDTLNRLLSASGPGLITRSFNYNAIGNMTYKSDVGTYTYPAVSAAWPHAVSSITNGGAANSITASYGYDGNGSLTSASGTIYPATGSVSFIRTLTYTGFNMPATVNQTQGGFSYSYTYTYSAEHERVRLVTVRPTQRITSIYVHPAGNGTLLYEKEIHCPTTAECLPTDPGAITENKHYVNGGSGLVGVFVTKSAYDTGDGPQMRYYHRDHLGSVAVITNPSAAVLERLAYEAFGERRSPNGTPQNRASPLFGVTTDRGFTAHEHLDELNLIHVNGRIYDPALARFVTPDPFISDPRNLQSFNRYAYAMNGPLNFVDPTGYQSAPIQWIDGPGPVERVPIEGRRPGWADGVFRDPGAIRDILEGLLGGRERIGNTPDRSRDSSPKPQKPAKGLSLAPFKNCDPAPCPEYTPPPKYTYGMRLCFYGTGGCGDPFAPDAHVRFVYPGQDPSQPITTTPSLYPVYGPGGIFVGRIIAWVSEDGTTTFSVTASDHWFRYGVVQRELIYGVDGIYVVTSGWGTNEPWRIPGTDLTIPLWRSLNQGVAWPVFYRLNDDMRNYMRWESLRDRLRDW